MKLNFRHAVVGTALALACSSAMSAEVNTGDAQYSVEGLQLVGGELTLGGITVTLGTNYSFNDIIEVAVTGANLVAADDQTANVFCPATALTPLAPTKPNTLRFRVADPEGGTQGENCFVNTLAVDAESVASSGEFGVCWTAIFGTEVIDSGCTDEKVLTAKEQLTAKVKKALDGVIDVETLRKKFTVGNDSDVTDTLTLTLTNVDAGFTAPTVDVTKTTLTILGDFSWTDGADTGTTCSNAELDAAIAQPAGWAIVGTGNSCSKVAFSTDIDFLGDQSFIVTIPGTKAITPTDFTGSVHFDYTETGEPTNIGDETNAIDPGKWTLNGALIYINYMPYNGLGGNISRIVYLSNRGTQSGNIDVTVLPESGAPACTFAGGTLAGGQVKKMTEQLDEAVFGCFGNDFSGKVHMIITVNAPKDDVEAYSAYNVGGSDRGTVVNTSNGRLVSDGENR